MRITKIKKTFAVLSLWTCLHHMVILKSQNKITDFFMILAWASPFKTLTYHMSHMKFKELQLKKLYVRDILQQAMYVFLKNCGLAPWVQIPI